MITVQVFALVPEHITGKRFRTSVSADDLKNWAKQF